MFPEKSYDILLSTIRKMETACMEKKTDCLKISLILFAAAGILQLAARRLTGFGSWYAEHVYPVIVGTYGRLCGLFPFSVAEVGAYFLIIAAIVYIMRHRREPLRMLSRGVLFLSLLAFLFTVNCGVNYYRLPFSSYLEVEVKQSSAEELRKLCEFLTDQVNETVDGSGYEKGWNEEALRSMASLGEVYPELAGYYPQPKPLLVSWILSVQQLSGIYLPFTVEANYNKEMTAYNIPHTICHELSHLKGFMREDEANFIGYLACIGSNNQSFQYSGYLTGWIYATNALAKMDMEAYRALYETLDPKVIAHLQENSAFWNQYEGKVAEVSNQMNDTYLKLNDQSDGVQSYGRVVDLMLAYYREEN